MPISKEHKLTKPSEGWWACQRQMMASLEGRCMVLDDKIKLAVEKNDTAEAALLNHEYIITDTIRRHLKNTLLWDTSRGE
jgi:hypothetical protein